MAVEASRRKLGSFLAWLVNEFASYLLLPGGAERAMMPESEKL
jgi:hypothetical protein